MSRKYISQIDNQNFVYPNNAVPEYDLDIVHDINDNSVSGVVTTFSATTFNSTGLTISYECTWTKNNADPFINGAGNLMLFSTHMMAAGQNYYKPFRLVHSIDDATTTLTGSTKSGTFTVTPSQMGLTGFTNGDYYFEVRFIGKRAVYPVCVTLSLIPPTPTPTPTPTSTVTPTPTVTITPTPTPTPTITVTPTPTVTVTPTPTPVPRPCVCVELIVTGSTAPEESYAGDIEYNNCDGVLVAEAFTTPGVRYRCIDYTGNLLQIFSSTNIVYSIASGLSCSTGTCPTGTTITCVCYSYENTTAGSLTIDYVACDGSQPIIGIPGGSSGTFCARIGQYTGDTGLDISLCSPTIYCQDTETNCEACGGPTPTPTPTVTVTPTPTPTPTVTVTPTPTPEEECDCYCVTYYPVDLPNDLYVRYALCGTSSTETELISALESVDNLDGTYTSCICVKQGGAYATPVCVQGGLEIVCPSGISWVQGGSCTSYTTCLPTQYSEFTGCGRGNDEGEACNDATANSRTFYSNCDSGTFGTGCYVYTDTSGTALTGYTNVFMNGANWDISPVTGLVTAYSSNQC